MWVFRLWFTKFSGGDPEYYLKTWDFLICELFSLAIISIICDSNGIKLMPALINMMTGMDASALEPAIMYIVNSTKFGSKLANPGQSICVIFGTPMPSTDRIYKMHQNQSNHILIEGELLIL